MKTVKVSNIFGGLFIEVPSVPTIKEQLFELFDAAHHLGLNISDVGNALTTPKAAACYRTYWRRERGISSARKDRQAA